MTKSSPLSLTCAILLAVASAQAGDWPAWGGCDLGRNMVSSETGLPETFKPGEKSPTGDGMLPGTTENVRWVVKLGTFICGNPTVADGRVFVGTDDASLQGDTRLKRTKGGMVWCLDEKTGQTLWRLPVPARPKERLAGECALRPAEPRRVLLAHRRRQPRLCGDQRVRDSLPRRERPGRRQRRAHSRTKPSTSPARRTRPCSSRKPTATSSGNTISSTNSASARTTWPPAPCWSMAASSTSPPPMA